MFTDNAYVTILLCSYLGVKDGNYKDSEDRQPEKFKKMFAEFVLNDLIETVK
ncbi:MAG: hypothetical protein KBA50_03695 [Sedimentibacter sp.]|nr:hypothetical protein [Sedimentibacter sp.]